jgi:hypothetical protein
MLDDDGLTTIVQAVPGHLAGPDFLDALHAGLRACTGTRTEFDDDISAAFLEYGGP